MPNNNNQVTFVTDEFVAQNSGRSPKKTRDSKYARRVRALSRRPGEWGIIHTSWTNGYIHTLRYNLKPRFPHVEWAIVRNPDKVGNVRWSLVGRVAADQPSNQN